MTVSRREEAELCEPSRRGFKTQIVVGREKLQPSDPEAMELYLDLYSPPCRATFLFAKAAGIPFEFKYIDLGAGQQFSEEFGKLNIIRKVPALKDGGFVLTESIPILKYMAQKHSSSVADHWFPTDLQLQARLNEYLSWQHTNLRAHAQRLFLLKAMYPAAVGSEPPKDKVDAALEDVKGSLNLFEEKFLQSKPFIVGDKITLADIVAVVEVIQPLGVGVDLFEGRPKLLAWRERVKKQLGEKLFKEAHEDLMDISVLRKKIENNPKRELFKQKLLR